MMLAQNVYLVIMYITYKYTIGLPKIVRNPHNRVLMFVL